MPGHPLAEPPLPDRPHNAALVWLPLHPLARAAAGPLSGCIAIRRLRGTPLRGRAYISCGAAARFLAGGGRAPSALHPPPERSPVPSAWLGLHRVERALRLPLSLSARRALSWIFAAWSRSAGHTRSEGPPAHGAARTTLAMRHVATGALELDLAIVTEAPPACHRRQARRLDCAACPRRRAGG